MDECSYLASVSVELEHVWVFNVSVIIIPFEGARFIQRSTSEKGRLQDLTFIIFVQQGPIWNGEI